MAIALGRRRRQAAIAEMADVPPVPEQPQDATDEEPKPPKSLADLRSQILLDVERHENKVRVANERIARLKGELAEVNEAIRRTEVSAELRRQADEIEGQQIAALAEEAAGLQVEAATLEERLQPLTDQRPNPSAPWGVGDDPPVGCTDPRASGCGVAAAGARSPPGATAV